MKITILILLIFNTIVLTAQNTIDTTYKVNILISACPTFNFYSEQRAPGVDDYQSIGYGILIRGMWHPGRSLAVGLMSGYIQLSNDKFPETENASARLSAVPMQMALSMRFSALELGMGLGPYLLLSEIDYITVAKSNRLELGVTFFGSYYIPIQKNLYIGFEARVLYLSFRGVGSIMPSLNFRYTFVEY